MARNTSLSAMPRRRSVSRNSMRPTPSWSRADWATCRLLSKDAGKPRHEGLVGHVEPERRHRNALFVERVQVAALRRARNSPAAERDPVVRVAAAVPPRLDVQQFLVALAL